jgi:hypothetical protein
LPKLQKGQEQLHEEKNKIVVTIKNYFVKEKACLLIIVDRSCIEEVGSWY